MNLKTKLPKVSIIVPVYNVEKYLKRCIDSLINQTYSNIEIILVNDGSTDLSGSICENYANMDERVVVVHKSNGGQGSARNRGIDLAQGDYIGFVDADDWVRKNMFETLVTLCEDNSCEIAICKMFSNESSTDTSIGVSSKLQKKDFMPLLLKDAITSHPCNKLFLKSTWNNIRFPDRNSVDDAMIMHKIFENAINIISTNEEFYYYYNDRTDSVSNNRDTRTKNSLERAVAFRIRYYYAKDFYPQVSEYVLAIVLRWSLITIKNIRATGEYIDKEKELRTFIKNEMRMILSNRNIKPSHKMAAFLTVYLPDIYSKLVKIKE